MTRINLIDPKFLCDQHLLAEHRELTRIPNSILSGKYSTVGKHIPTSYILGTDHVTFFLNKIDFLFERYVLLHQECLNRNFAVTWRFPSLLSIHCSKIVQQIEMFVPTKQDKSLNKARLIERTPRKVLFHSTEITQIQYIQMLMNEKVFDNFSPF